MIRCHFLFVVLAFFLVFNLPPATLASSMDIITEVKDRADTIRDDDPAQPANPGHEVHIGDFLGTIMAPQVPPEHSREGKVEDLFVQGAGHGIFRGSPEDMASTDPPDGGIFIHSHETRQDASVMANQQFLYAVSEGSLEKVKSCLAEGIDVNTRNAFGEGALHLAQDVKMAAFLIQNGVNLEMQDYESGLTALFYHGTDIAKLLIDAGADVNARSYKGNTPLMWYAYNGYFEGIRYLISRGAEINARNHDGQTALDIAERFAHRSVSDFLRSEGALSGNR